MLKKFYKIVIVPYTLFLLYLMFFGMGRFQYEDNLITVEPVFSTIKFIQGLLEGYRNDCSGKCCNVYSFWFSGLDFSQAEIKPSFYFYSAITIVEGLQYFTRMGIFEVDDIILNTFGVFRMVL
jgi:glycopeptide antibiotics resistance protein